MFSETKKECVAMLLAGGRGSRLYALTDNIAKPAVTFAGKYRIIDFPLSNCVNSGIDTVGILTQYQPLLLNNYIGKGQAWDLDRISGGATILPPYSTDGGGTWYSGTANAIFQNIAYVDNFNPEYVLILSGDHVYKMDYAKMLTFHKEKSADLTIAVIRVPFDEAHQFGIMNTDESLRITEFEEKPIQPKGNLASMGIYIFTWEKLRLHLMRDEEDERSEHDFGKDVIPRYLKGEENVFAFRFDGYWKDVGTIDALWQANMDMLSGMALGMPSWQIMSRAVGKPPHYIGGKGRVSNCLMTEGCEIDGSIRDCILSSGVVVEEGAELDGCVVMANCVIRRGAKISRAILSEGALVAENVTIGNPEHITVVTPE
ncbi:MAG: glucose-1-phosphate adenylyltransferase [Oscillospiraceae bacterium]|jgi:glucose-1-phosphate adenylyltransferase|nr:glucose-1-phosphate adenylyltransferase [Oscillospiraceae bacterium]